MVSATRSTLEPLSFRCERWRRRLRAGAPQFQCTLRDGIVGRPPWSAGDALVPPSRPGGRLRTRGSALHRQERPIRLAAILLISSAAFAQSGGGITGAVTDTDGTSLPK